MKNVLTPQITFLFIAVILTAYLIGCSENRKTIFDMGIEEIQIIVGKTDKEFRNSTEADALPLYSVVVWVYGIAGPNTCYGHHRTHLLRKNNYGRNQSLYHDGETINISISAIDGSGNYGCGDETIMHQEAIFIGLCVPGNYVLNINGIITRFQVGSDLNLEN